MDKNLIDKARNGDRSAEKDLFSYLFVRFLFIVKQRLGERDAEDIAQDACVTVLEKFREQDGPENFEAWAYQILRNKIGNAIKKRDIERKRMTNFDEKLTGTEIQAEGSITEFRNRLLKCLRKLIKGNKRYARAVNLVYQGFTTDEICNRMNINSNNLYVILNRGRAVLLNCLESGRWI